MTDTVIELLPKFSIRSAPTPTDSETGTTKGASGTSTIDGISETGATDGTSQNGATSETSETGAANNTSEFDLTNGTTKTNATNGISETDANNDTSGTGTDLTDDTFQNGSETGTLQTVGETSEAPAADSEDGIDSDNVTVNFQELDEPDFLIAYATSMGETLNVTIFLLCRLQ